ncbi:MAG: MOSC N-terminal beta barrel domain-containing protein [Candidatus Acidiferrum sp.]
MTDVQPRLARIRIHPIKSLDPIEVSEARIGPSGGLEHDRAWALFSVDGRWVNAKRTAAMHLIRAAYAPNLSCVTLSVPGDRRNMFTAELAFPGDTERAAQWFSAYFEQQILVRYSADGFPDDTLASGPTIVSTASLEAVGAWFELCAENVRKRFRASLEVDGVPAFWEDQLFGDDERRAVRFKIGDVSFEGSNPCARCPVPPRDPHTGEDLVGFQKRFVEQRKALLPPWSPVTRFDHFYRLSTNTRVPSAEAGKLLRLGDSLRFAI